MALGKKTGGRQKGARNKVTQGAVANVMEVFDMLGGAKGFAEWATENKTEYYKHYAKLIPLQINGAGDDGEHVIKFSWQEK
jgi:hypothetical protein